MNFKATIEGVYDVTNFTAKNLSSLVKMVKLNEQYRIEIAELAAKQAAEAEKELNGEPPLTSLN